MKNDRLQGTIEVNGTAEIEVAPDEAIVELSVITEGKTASAAVSANAKRTTAVVEAVSAEPNHGVTTTGLAVSPIYERKPDSNVSTIVGFRASNTVKVQTKPGYAGQIFDVGVEAGANQSSGISFRLQDETPIREEALRMAVKNAFAEARIVAETADVTLDGPERIQIDPGSGPILFRAAALSAESAPTPVIPEDITVRANVRIVFRTRG